MNEPKILRHSFHHFARLAALVSFSISLLGLAQADKPADPAKSEKLPAASEIVAKFVKAIGGKEAFGKMNSQKAKGKFEMPAQGISGEMEVFAKRPNKMFIKINIPGIGDVTTGYDGKVAWSLNAATGPMVMDGKQLDQMKDQADFDAVLHEEGNYKSMETVEKSQFDGKECYKLKLVRKTGQEVTEYYDTKTSLLVGSAMTQESPLGPLMVTNILGDYKKFGDILFATKVIQKMGPIEQTMTLNSFELNKVEDTVFNLPEQVKAMVK